MIELDSAHIILTQERQRKLHESAWLSFNFLLFSLITLLEKCSSSLVISGKNLIFKYFYESCE